MPWTSIAIDKHTMDKHAIDKAFHGQASPLTSMPWTSISIDKHGMDNHALAKLAMYNHCSAKLGNDNKLP
jgi:hypothetical protein